MPLNDSDFLQVIACTPLVSIDLVVQNDAGQVLLGRRTREPAKNTWFVPGGRIRKNETLDEAFLRLSKIELGTPIECSEGKLFGAFTHLYETNFAEAEGIGTHYVVLAYLLQRPAANLPLPKEQHNAYHWMNPEDALRDPEVHPHVFPYLREIISTTQNLGKTPGLEPEARRV